MEQMNLDPATDPDQERGRPPRQLDERERLPPVLAPHARPVPVERIGRKNLTVNHEPAVFAAVDDSDLARQTRPAAERDSRPLDHTERRTVGRPIDRAGLGSSGGYGAFYADACRIWIARLGRPGPSPATSCGP